MAGKEQRPRKEQAGRERLALAEIAPSFSLDWLNQFPGVVLSRGLVAQIVFLKGPETELGDVAFVVSELTYLSASARRHLGRLGGPSGQVPECSGTWGPGQYVTVC